MGISSDLSGIKRVSDTLTGNKVARFAYTQQAYNDDDADGVQAYNVNNEQNIPVASASIMKVNDTVIDKGWRAQASSITRMLMNHFLGRLSYNVNKLTDMMSSLLTALSANLGVVDGIATLDSNGYVPSNQLSPTGVVKTINDTAPIRGNINITKNFIGLNNVVNTGDSDTPVSGGTDKFTTGGAYEMRYNIQQSILNLQGSVGNLSDNKAPNYHASTETEYGVATDTLYGHVKRGPTIVGSPSNCATLMVETGAYTIVLNNSGFGKITIIDTSNTKLYAVIDENCPAKTLALLLFTIDGSLKFYHTELYKDNIAGADLDGITIPPLDHSGTYVVIALPSRAESAEVF